MDKINLNLQCDSCGIKKAVPLLEGGIPDFDAAWLYMIECSNGDNCKFEQSILRNVNTTELLPNLKRRGLI
jgi:hypothetical protein